MGVVMEEAACEGEGVVTEGLVAKAERAAVGGQRDVVADSVGLRD